MSDNVNNLPAGYFAVFASEEEASLGFFKYKGVTYRAELGVNLFTTMNDAYVAATTVPTEILKGLDYESFTTPVVLIGEGVHYYNKGTPGGRSIIFDHSVTVLGEGACQNPNVRSIDPFETPSLNPEREGHETVLKGSFWWGRFNISKQGIDTLIFDGITFSQIWLTDERCNEELDAFISFRNIIYVSPTYRTMFQFTPTKESSGLHRFVELRNLRIIDMDDLDFGYSLATPAVDELVIDGLVVDTTTQIFGFTSIIRDVSNVPKNAESASISIKNSFIKSLLSENAISTACFDVGDRRFSFSVEDSVFVDASRENEPVLNPELASNACTLTLKNARFLDTRGNLSSAVCIYGEGNSYTVEDCSFEGFSADISRYNAPPKNAPDYLESKNADWTSETDDPHTVIGKENLDLSSLDASYEGRRAYYGDLHVHTRCGGGADGSFPMSEWPRAMDELDLDFVAVVDHRQMRGFFLPEWNEERFIIGTEPGTSITNLNAGRYNLKGMHYNMLFPHKYGLAMVLANFPEYNFSGTELDGLYSYPSFTKERFSELVKYVHSIGGMVVHPHPKSLMCSDDPLDYYIGEHTYLETLYDGYSSNCSFRNYTLWCKLLELGKHVYASSGSDTHTNVRNDTVATFYTKERSGRTFFDTMKRGDFSVGAVGIKMAVDGKPIGSELAWREGMILEIRLDDFYRHEWKPETAYRVRVISDRGVAYESTYNGKLPQTLALRAEKRKFYRVEIFDLTHGYIVGHSNPIWLDAEM